MHFKNIIQTIKRRRDDLKVTQEDLSIFSGVGLRTIKKFEAGKGNPTLETLEKICDALGLEIYLEVKNLRNHEEG